MERNHFTKTSEIIMYPDGSSLGCNVYLDELDKNRGTFAEGINDCMHLYSGLIENIYKTVIIEW